MNKRVRTWDGREELIPGYLELSRPLADGGFVRFSVSSAAKVLAQAVSWLDDQARRSDGGALSRSRVGVRSGQLSAGV